jgi:F0F1-type ATP synthase membrane subunit b/b'
MRKGSRGRPADSRLGALDTTARLLSLAQQTADQAIADAEAEAARIIAEARETAAQIIADARAKASGPEPF